MKKIIAIIAIVLVSGCATKPISGFDGSYVLVRKGEQKIGAASNMDLYQRHGETGKGKPVYTRRLQATGSTSSHMFMKAGVLE
jgi:hypothetical protein